MKKIVLLLMPFIFVACSSVKNEERIFIRYKSSGCFHFYKKTYEFKNGTVTISEGDKKGTVKVTKEELSKLDKLFQFYEKNPFLFGSCTTHVNIDYELYRDDKLIKSKSYWDDSCSDFKDKNITTLYYFDKKLAQKRGEKQ